MVIAPCRMNTQEPNEVAAQPKFRALVARIEAMPGGWDDIIDAIANGATYRMLAEKFEVSRAFMHRVVTHDPERRKRAEAAYAERAHAMIDEAIDIADTVNVNLPAAVQKAKLQIELRQWLAAVDNARFQKANAAQVSVHLTIGQLHLDALRRRRVTAVAHTTAGLADTQGVTPLIAPPVVDAEIVEE